MTDCESCLRFHYFGVENNGLGHCVFYDKDVSALDPACEAHSDERLVDVLERLFVNRADTYAVQREDGQYLRVNEPLTRHILRHHLAGEVTVGAYQINPSNNSVRWLCLDVDPEHVKDPRKTALELYNFCKNSFSCKSVWLEASRHSDPSYHVWVFFKPEIQAKAARWLGRKTLEHAGAVVELFPKQDEVRPSDFGNLVKLPLGLHRTERKWSKFLSPTTFSPLPDTCLYDAEGCSFSESDLQKICELADRERRSIEKRLSPLPIRTRSLDENETSEIVTLLAKYWRPRYRNRLEMSFLGFCLKRGVSYESAYKIVDQVATSTNDEEHDQRLELVKYHYQNRQGLGSKLKGLSGLTEVIRKAINDEGIS